MNDPDSIVIGGSSTLAQGDGPCHPECDMGHNDPHPDGPTIRPGIDPDTYLVERQETIEAVEEGGPFPAWVMQLEHAAGPYAEAALQEWLAKGRGGPGRYRLLTRAYGAWTMREFNVEPRTDYDITEIGE